MLISPLMVTLLVAVSPAMAQGLPKGCDFSQTPGQDASLACYQDLDRNGDGALSPEEAQVLPRLRGRFGDLDADGNGALSPDEFQAGETSPTQRGGAKGV